MRSRAFLSLGLMLLALGTFGQGKNDTPVGPQQRKKFRMGFQVRPSIDWFTPNTDGVDLEGVRVKFGYGLMAEYAFTNNYALTFGIEHRMSGAELSFADAAYKTGTDTNNLDVYRLNSRLYRMDYVNVPITLKLMTNEIGYMTYFGQFGVDFSFLASAKAIDSRVGIMDSTLTVVETDPQDIYSKSSFANIKLNIAAGAEWNFSGNTSLVFSVSYHHGFIDVIRDPDNIGEQNLFKLSTINDTAGASPLAATANLHHVSLNVGILF
jgi:hypothetical protein